MSAANGFTDEEKAGFIALAQKKGRAKAATKAGVSTTTISSWGRAAGVDFRKKVEDAAPVKKRRAARKNGNANGHAPPNGHAPAVANGGGAVGQLQAVRAQLQSALQALDTMQSAYRQVFG